MSVTRTSVLLLTWAAAQAVGPPGDGRSMVVPQRRQTHAGTAVVDVSADGRYVAFESTVRLSTLDTNNGSDIYVIDRTTGALTLESLPSGVATVPGSSTAPRLSGDGRYLVFTSLVHPTDSTAALSQVLLKDRTLQQTVLVSRTRAGAPGDGWSIRPDISDDGRTVVFDSSATDLGDGSNLNGTNRDVYAFDAGRQVVTRISGGEFSFDASISADGRFVAYTAGPAAARLAIPSRPSSRPDEPESGLQVYVYDAWRASTRLVSHAPDDSASNGRSFAPAISADGRWVAFTSTASNLAGRDTNRTADVFLYDLETARTTLVSRRAGGGSADGPSRHPALSANGRYVVFVSRASNLSCARRCPPYQEDRNFVEDIYRFDRVTGTALRITGLGQAQWWEGSDGPAIDAEGRVIAFSTLHPIGDDDIEPDFDLRIEVVSEPSAVAAPLPQPPGKHQRRQPAIGPGTRG